MIEIHPAGPADAAAIAATVNRAFEVEAFFVEGPRVTVEEIARRMITGRFLVAGDGGTLVGCVYLEPRPPARAYVGLLAVEPSRAGEGIGRRLMEAAEAAARVAGAVAVDITVVDLRTELFPFYAALGYTRCGEAPFAGATKRPCRFVLMSKTIGSGR